MPSIRVVKVGGSLLTRQDLPEALRRWIERKSHARTILVVGGGEPVNHLRRQDILRPLDQEKAHWMSIDWMDRNARALSVSLPNATLTDRFNLLTQAHDVPGVTIFLVRTFLQEIEPASPGRKLPTSWSVTSDSIAARLAIILGAGLTLLKSRLPDNANDPIDWRWQTNDGFVDSFFPLLANDLAKVDVATLDFPCDGSRTFAFRRNL